MLDFSYFDSIMVDNFNPQEGYQEEKSQEDCYR